MKANKAPEKIYLEKVYPDNGVLPNGLNYNQSPNDIEYTRTDAFIEKAVAFLKERIILEDNSWYIEGQVTLKDKMIEDFKEYLKK